MAAFRKAAGSLSPASLSEPLVRLLNQQPPLKLAPLRTALTPRFLLRLCLCLCGRLRLRFRRRRRRRRRRHRRRCVRSKSQPLPSGSFCLACELLLLCLVVRMQCDPLG